MRWRVNNVDKTDPARANDESVLKTKAAIFLLLHIQLSQIRVKIKRVVQAVEPKGDATTLT